MTDRSCCFGVCEKANTHIRMERMRENALLKPWQWETKRIQKNMCPTVPFSNALPVHLKPPCGPHALRMFHCILIVPSWRHWNTPDANHS